MAVTECPYPAPKDDGAAAHLVAGVELPDIELPTTTGDRLSLARISGLSIIFVYPWTGRPGHANPPGLGQHPRRAWVDTRGAGVRGVDRTL